MNKAVKAVVAMAMSAGLTIGAASLANADSNSTNCGPTGNEMSPPTMGIRPNFDYIFKQLAITEEQGEQVLEILKKQHDSMKESREADADQQTKSEPPTPPTEEEIEAMKTAMRTNLSAALTSVLTNEQIEGFLDYLEAHMSMGEPHGKGPGRPDFKKDSDSTDTES